MELAIGGDGNTIDKLHDEVGIARRGCARVQDGCDVGVIQLGQDAPLILEAAYEEIVQMVVAQDFDSDAFLEFAVGPSGFKNHTHPAAAHFLHQAISAQLYAGDDEGAGY